MSGLRAAVSAAVSAVRVCLCFCFCFLLHFLNVTVVTDIRRMARAADALVPCAPGPDARPTAEILHRRRK